MTGRVCPVHGEWSESGVCRWCEPATEKYSRAACDDVSIFRGVEYDWTRGPAVETPEQLARIANIDEEPPQSGAIVDAINRLWLTLPGPQLRSWMRPLFSTRQRYSTPEGVASHNASWEAKLAQEHAALRWERVARRWAAKGPTPSLHRKTVDGVNAFDDHCAECLREGRGVPP